MGSATFSGLPLELRNKIYESVYSATYIQPYISISGTRHLYMRQAQELFAMGISEPQKILALLLVNHQVSAEAAAAFYGKLTVIGENESLLAFFKGIGPHRRDLLRSVEIQIIHDFDTSLPWWTLLSMTSSPSYLQTITFTYGSSENCEDVWAFLVEKEAFRFSERIKLREIIFRGIAEDGSWSMTYGADGKPVSDQIVSRKHVGTKAQHAWEQVKIESFQIEADVDARGPYQFA